MIKLMLNLHKFNNYAFFCPVSRLHLTVSSPVGFSNEVTPAILKALKAETVLDVDGVIDIETGTVKAGTQAPKQEKPVEKAPETKQEAPAKAEEPKVEAPKVEEPKAEEAKVEEASAEEKPKKGGKKAAKTADAE
jgi:hypothetical protein